MLRTRVIALLFIASLETGCSSPQYLENYPFKVAPIARTESFYIVDKEKPSTETNFHSRSTLVRLDPDGSINRICEIDTSLGISDEVTEANEIVMYGAYGTQPRMYNVTTGQFRPAEDRYKHTSIGDAPSGHELDSIKKIPFLKDLNQPRFFRLSKPDYFLVHANVPDTLNQTVERVSIIDNTVDSTFDLSLIYPHYYWFIADMNGQAVTKIADEVHLYLSGSRKAVMYLYLDKDRKRRLRKNEEVKIYPRFIDLEEYLK